MLRTYTPSGKCSPLTILALPVMVMFAVALAEVYTLLMEWIPFIYIDAVLVFAFAVGIALIVGKGLRVAKCRNVPIGIAIGVIVGVAAISAAHLFAFWDFNGVLKTKGFQATDFFTYLRFRASTGWTIGHGSSGGTSSGIPITGVFVWAIWLIEAGVLVFAGSKGGMIGAKSPFCEACDVSAGKGERKFLLPGITAEGIRGIASADDLEGVLQPPLSEVSDAESGVEYDVKSCPKCERVGFLTISQKLVFLNAKKQKETKLTVLRKNVELTGDEMEAMGRLEADIKEALTMSRGVAGPAAVIDGEFVASSDEARTP